MEQNRLIFFFASNDLRLHVTCMHVIAHDFEHSLCAKYFASPNRKTTKFLLYRNSPKPALFIYLPQVHGPYHKLL